MKNKTLDQIIKEAVTYYSDDPLGGTSGYLLSNEKMKKLKQDLITYFLSLAPIDKPMAKNM